MVHLDSDAPPAYETASSGQNAFFGVTLHEDAGKSLLVTITPPREPIAKEKHPGRRAPLDLCLVIDVSGSMSTDAPGLSEDGKSKEDTGLNVLDVVKHACRTILSTMRDDDRISIVTFSHSAKIVSNFRETTEASKKSLLESIEKLHPHGTTNLWDGLRTGMNLFNGLPASTTSRLSTLFILTDGRPNVEPPRGHIPMLEHYLESHPIVRSALTISSFGFGYRLDSMLLSEIGRVGGGAYSFIPDAGLVGTVFVHAVANMYSTYAIQSTLNVEVPEGVKVKKVRGGFNKLDASWGSKVEFGDLQYGQTRDIILEFEGGDQGKLPEVTVSVVAKPWFANEAFTVPVTHTPSAAPTPTTDAHKYHLHRLDLVDSIFSICSTKTQSATVLETAAQNFETQSRTINTSLPNYPDAVALASDIGGEVVLALSEQENWTKWGKHYFPALARAHQRQQCSNFKDAGLQVYGQHSPLFIKSRDELDAAFDELPPPKPFKTVYFNTSPNTLGGQASTAGAAAIAPTSTAPSHGYSTTSRSMASYNRRYGGCFAGECQVLLEDGKVALQELKRGMKVITPKGTRRVGAVLRIAIEGGRLMMCKIGELKVTPWHPICVEGKWVFPADVVEAQSEECDAVYTVLLEVGADVDAHAFEVEGITAVTLGHGLVTSKEADARGHPFFGSYTKVLDSLKNLAGFESEEGVAHCVGVHRDSAGLICGFSKPAINTTSLDAFSHTLMVSA